MSCAKRQTGAVHSHPASHSFLFDGVRKMCYLSLDLWCTIVNARWGYTYLFSATYIYRRCELRYEQIWSGRWCMVVIHTLLGYLSVDKWCTTVNGRWTYSYISVLCYYRCVSMHGV